METTNTTFETNPAPRLAGERIALVGRLASMSRSEAAKVIAAAGGEMLPAVDGRATLLVRGDETTGPDLPEDVRQAVAAGRMALLDESQLWRRLGLVDEAVGVSRLYTPALLAEMVNVEPRVVRRWQRRGYLLPTCEVRKLSYFDFSELRVARRLADLLHAGVSLAVIDRRMAELTRLAPDTPRPLADLSIVVDQGKIYLRRGDDLTEPSGQVLMDFEMAPPAETSSAAFEFPQPAELADAPPAREDIRSAAFDLQDDGEPARALEIWRSVLLAGGASADDHFVAADLLYQSGDLAAARERYYMAIEIDDAYDEARVNLGCVLAELGELQQAVAAFRGAVAGNADLADAHYHLAATLGRLGQEQEATQHWQAFLHLAPESPWAEEAREQLAGEGIS